MGSGTESRVRFYRTNTVADEGYEPDPAEVAEQFWASEDGARWREGGHRFERLFIAWCSKELGGWNPEADGHEQAWDALLVTVWDARGLIIAYPDAERDTGPVR